MTAILIQNIRAICENQYYPNIQLFNTKFDLSKKVIDSAWKS